MNDSSGETSLRIPGFEQLEEIGRGGFGIVYRAYQPALERSVAVKVLVGAAVDTRAQERFERERKTMGSLSSHPAIVTIFDSGLTAEGVPYLVMELMEGGSLGDRIKHDGPLPWAEAVAIGARIADALETAHHAGVVHRDLKPDNVLLSRYDEAKLTDFGIAALLDATGTRSGGITASVAHAAPEVLEGKRATPRSDVYSLASTIYALIAGQAAFTRPTDEGMTPVIARILTEDPPDLRPGVPDAVCRVLERGLAKAPDDRFASAAAMAQALRDAGSAPAAPLSAAAALAATGEVPVPSDATRVVHPTPTESSGRSRRALVLAIGAAVAAAAIFVGVAVAGGGDDTPGPGDEVAAGGTTATGGKSGTGAATSTSSGSSTTSTLATTSTSPITGSPGITSGTANSILGAATTVATPATAAAEEPEAPAPSPAPVRPPSPSPSPSPAPTPVPEPPAPTPPPTPTPPPPPAHPTVPSVIGLDLATATARLNGAGFTNTPTETGCYGGTTNGVIYSQSPSGVPADPSTAIILRLEGNDCEFVPSLIGLTQSAAESQLNGLGFAYQWLYECYNSPNIGTVVSQSPVAGADVTINTTVFFYLQANNCAP